MGERIRKRVVVTGRVQGVWFRATTREAALRNGVDGWVRNLPDGSVEASFEGTLTGVDKMVEWSKQGPPRAYVSGIEVSYEDPEGLSGFEIR